MKPVDQTTSGPQGDCLRACVASVLEVALEEVPMKGGGAIDERVMHWLSERNLALVHHPIINRNERGEASYWYYGYVILLAESPRGSGQHAVVLYDGEIVHDPHPKREQGVGKWMSYMFFAAIDPAKMLLPPRPLISGGFMTLITRRHSDAVIINACRYCLGRSTYAVLDMVNYLGAWWEELEPNTQFVIQRDIRAAIEKNEAGMDMDVRDWQRILDLPAKNQEP